MRVRAITTAALSLALLAATPAVANANANDAVNEWAGPLAGIFGGAFAIPVADCPGGPSISQVQGFNATNQTQTGSITIGPGLTNQAAVFPSLQALEASAPWGLAFDDECPPRPLYPERVQFQQSFTLGAGQGATFWVAMGGQDYNLYTSTNNIAVGGLPSGTPGASWYDFNVELTGDLNYGQLLLEYNGTGGINSDNNQNGFNVVACQTKPNGAIFPTPNVLSPYGAESSLTYGWNAPVCLAWLPEGQMLNLADAEVISGTIINNVTGSQFDPTGDQLNLSATLQPGTTITGITTVTGIVGSPGVLSSTLGSSAGSCIVNPQGTELIIEGVQLSCNFATVNISGSVNGVATTDAIYVTDIPNMDPC